MQHRFDAITEESLRDAGSVKWTRFPGTIGSFIAEMDFGIAPEISQALTSSFEAGLTGYLPRNLNVALRREVTRWYSEKYGWDVPHVELVPDVLVAYAFAIETLTKPGAAVIIPTPAYMPFLTTPQRLGRRVIEVPSVQIDGRWTIDHAGVAAAFADGGELLVLCNPHNPLGTVATRDELVAIEKTVTDAGGTVFSDEIHAPLIYAGAQHVPYASISDAAAAHTLTATSASKAWNLAGFKCAQLLFSNQDHVRAWRESGGAAGDGTATVGVIANLAAFSASEAWLEDVTDYLDGNRRLLRDLVAEKLPGVTVTFPEGTYIALLDFRETGLTGDLGAWFREHAGVSMTDGLACGQAGAGYTRFVFATPRPIMQKAIEQIAAALAAR